MKIKKVITAINENSLYTEFLPATYKAWNRLGVEVVVGIVTKNIADGDLVNWAFNYSDTLYVFSKIDSIDSGIQAKVTRMCLACEEQEHTAIVDVDMIPLSAGFVDSYNRVPNDHLAKFGAEHPAFQREPDIGKWPMHGTAADGETFREIINPNHLSYKQLILSWAGGFPEDPRSNVSNAFGSFSDESLLKCLYSRWRDKERTTCIERTEAGDFDQHPDGGYTVYGRLCRSKHHDLEQIDIGRYFEAHGPRPFSTNLEWYGKILDHLED